jgi:hypothetical protein
MFCADRSVAGAFDPFHEGEWVMPMGTLLRGGVPYRDVYLQHGLFANALVPLLGSKLFEPTVVGVRAVNACIGPMVYVAAYFLVFFTCRFRFLCAVFIAFLFCGSISIHDRGVLGLLCVAVLAGGATSNRVYPVLEASGGADPWPGARAALRLAIARGRPILLAGTVGMLAFWHSVEVGLYALGAGTIFLAAASFAQPGIKAWRRALPLALFGSGAVAAFLPFGLYFAFHGALDDMIRNVWIQCAFQGETWGKPFPSFFAVFKPILTGTGGPRWPDWLMGGGARWYYTPAMLVLSSGVLALRAMGGGFWRSRSAPRLLLVTLAAAAFFRTPMGRSDGHHIHYGILFGVVLAVCLVDYALAAAWDRVVARGISIPGRAAAILVFAAAVAPACALTWFVTKAFDPAKGIERRLSSARESGGKCPGQLSMPRIGSMPVLSRHADRIEKAVEYIRSNTGPSEHVFDFSSWSGLLFLADRPSATRYFHICYACLPRMQEEVVRDLERLKVRLVIFSSGSYGDGFDGVPAERRHPIVAAFLRANYEPAADIAGVVFWKRKAESGRRGES